MSSSRSGQCIPSPPPMRRQCARSSGVPCASRGNQERGTVTVLPSTRSTIRASSLTCMLCAMASLNSVSEILMPSPQKQSRPLRHHSLYPSDLHGAKPTAPFHVYRVQPKLCSTRFPLNAHVRRFVSVRRIEKERVRSGPKDGRQRPQCTRSTRGFSTKEKTAKWVLSPV